MFNNINDNGTEYLYNSQLDRQSSIINLAAIKANAQKAFQATNNNPYVDRTEISANALELFQRDCDINKFNKIAMSDLNDFSHLDRMNELFAEGVVDVFEDDVLSNLVNNSKLWEDLEL
ncbi:MAG: hypothetical protein E7Z92_01610 [Cyanobacteria bacterium SIG31]|nr:hypothetical protein [Cyanobacteria bacterium SIG31]